MAYPRDLKTEEWQLIENFFEPKDKRGNQRKHSQSVKTVYDSEECGYDGGKKVKGRKRHIVVDILGCLLLVQVHTANIHDTKAAGELMFRAADSYPSLKAFSANAGYRSTAVTYAPEQLGRTLYISEKIKGEFAVLPKRWGLEQTFAW